MRTRSSTGFNTIPENVAAVVFSHLGDDPRDRVALAQVSKVWRDAEKSDASLPGGSLSALSALSYELYIDGKYEHSIYWLRKAADRGDVDAMFEMAERYLYFDGFGETLDHKKASEWYERASGCGHAHATYELAWCYLYKEGDGVERRVAGLEKTKPNPHRHRKKRSVPSSHDGNVGFSPEPCVYPAKPGRCSERPRPARVCAWREVLASRAHFAGGAHL